MSKVTPKRLRELALIDATATPDEVRALVLEVKGARAMIEQFAAAQIPTAQRSCTCVALSVVHVDTTADRLAVTLN